MNGITCIVLFWLEPETSISGTAKRKSHATAPRAMLQLVNSVTLHISAAQFYYPRQIMSQ
jgi:hypothetical protein